MRAAPVKGTLARRKQSVEPRWSCQRLGSRRWAEVKAEVPEPIEYLGLTWGFLLGRIARDRRAVHDDLETLQGVGGNLSVILRAKIKGRICRHFAFGER